MPSLKMICKGAKKVANNFTSNARVTPYDILERKSKAIRGEYTVLNMSTHT